MNNVTGKFLEAPGNSPELCDAEKREPCLNDGSATGGETEKDVDEKVEKPADMKHEEQVCLLSGNKLISSTHHGVYQQEGLETGFYSQIN